MPGEISGGSFPVVFTKQFGSVREKGNLTPSEIAYHGIYSQTVPFS